MVHLAPFPPLCRRPWDDMAGRSSAHGIIVV